MGLVALSKGSVVHGFTLSLDTSFFVFMLGTVGLAQVLVWVTFAGKFRTYLFLL